MITEGKKKSSDWQNNLNGLVLTRVLLPWERTVAPNHWLDLNSTWVFMSFTRKYWSPADEKNRRKETNFRVNLCSCIVPLSPQPRLAIGSCWTVKALVKSVPHVTTPLYMGILWSCSQTSADLIPPLCYFRHQAPQRDVGLVFTVTL